MTTEAKCHTSWGIRSQGGHAATVLRATGYPLGIMGGAVRIDRRGETQAVEQALEPTAHDQRAQGLVAVLGVEPREPGGRRLDEIGQLQAARHRVPESPCRSQQRR